MQSKPEFTILDDALVFHEGAFAHALFLLEDHRTGQRVYRAVIMSTTPPTSAFAHRLQDYSQLASMARVVVKLGYAFDRALLEPVYVQPLLVRAREPSDEEIVERLGRAD